MVEREEKAIDDRNAGGGGLMVEWEEGAEFANGNREHSVGVDDYSRGKLTNSLADYLKNL